MKILNIMLSRDLGGIQQSFLDYSKMLQTEKFDVINISSLGAAINNVIKVDYKLLNLGNWDIFSSMKLKSIIRQENPDAIIAHGARAITIALRARKGKKPPMISVIHGDKLRWVSKCDYIIALTDIMKKIAIDSGIHNSRVALIPNAIDLSLCEVNPKKDDESPPPIIGTMGRFVPKKGFDVFLESLAILKKTGMQFKAIIGGGGEEEDSLKKLCNDLGLAHYVEFTGWVKDKEEFFNKLDIFCLPSYAEPFGIILLEAMAYQIPVISTKSNGPSEILEDGVDGILVDIGSAEQMADSIERLLDDEILADKLTSNAILKIQQKYDIRVVSKKLSKLLNNIIKKS